MIGANDNVNQSVATPDLADVAASSRNVGTPTPRTPSINFSAFASPGDNGNQVYVIFPAGRKYPISGACSLKVIVGSIRILGFITTANDAPVDICAPLSSNQYLIETESGLSGAEIEAQLPFLADSLKSLNQSVSFAVVTLSKHSNVIYGVAKSFSSLEGRSLSPVLHDNYTAPVKLIYELSGAVVGCEDRPVVEFWPQLSNALASIVQQSMGLDVETNKSSSRPVVIMVCGEKNAGKSTVCRAIINSLLSVPLFHEKGVAFFECDVGQTEFTPSGVISWSLIKRPLLEPPFMHMKCGASENGGETTSFAGTFYGDLSPGQSPNRYYECLKSVFSRIPQFARNNVPLVVNTMGWLKSLGLALLVDTYRLFQPDIVLHLRTAQDLSPQLNPAFFFAADGISSAPPGGSSGSATQGTRLPQHELLEVVVQRRVTVYKGHHNCPTPPPFFLRALSTIGHLALSKDVMSTSSLKSLPRCQLPFGGENQHIFAGICHERVPATETNRVLLGSLVALCRVDVRLPNGFSSPSFLLTLPSGWIGNEWIGLGIVMAIDEAGRKITIATPVADHVEALLGRVNCILMGSVTITQSAMMEIAPEHARQSVAQAQVIPTNSGPTERNEDDGSPFDAQRFGGRRDFMRRKRANFQLMNNSSNISNN